MPEVCDAITRAYRDQVMQCHTPRGLVAGQACLPLEVELSTCPACPGWKVYSISDVHKGEAAFSATARASTPLYSWPWWMEIPSSCGWTGGQPEQLNRKTLGGGGGGQPMIVLEGNNIPYEGCKAILAVKRQRNILRDYFMIDGQLHGRMNSS